MIKKLKALFLVVIFTLTLYVLVPSCLFFLLNKHQLHDIRKDVDLFLRYIPYWSLYSHIVPGIDLQGGIQLVLKVNSNRAIYYRLVKFAENMKKYALKHKVLFDRIKIKDNFIFITFLNNYNLSYYKKNVINKFDQLIILAEGNCLIKLKITDYFLYNFKNQIFSQSLKILKGRIKNIGINNPILIRKKGGRIQIQLPGLENIEYAKEILGRTAQLKFFLINDDSEFLLSYKKIPIGANIIHSVYSKLNHQFGKDIYLEFPQVNFNEIKGYLRDKIPSNSVMAYGKSITLKKEDSIFRTYLLYKGVILTGEDLLDSFVDLGNREKRNPSVVIKFNSFGSLILKHFTQNHIGKRIAIILESFVDSAPIVSEVVKGGSASISIRGNTNKANVIKDARLLSAALNAGSLPAPIKIIEENFIGSFLGKELFYKGFFSFSLTGFLILLFMIFRYRLIGLCSVVSVFLNIVFVLSVFSALGVTITLSGIAGLLLIIGMSVDANIIINDRIKKEVIRGWFTLNLVDNGYRGSTAAIVDSNITTFLSGLILCNYGTDIVQGFAVMLIIGTCFSLFTSFFVSRVLVDLLFKIFGNGFLKRYFI